MLAGKHNFPSAADIVGAVEEIKAAHGFDELLTAMIKARLAASDPASAPRMSGGRDELLEMVKARIDPRLAASLIGFATKDEAPDRPAR